MRVLFVSNTFPTDLRTNVTGVFQRMGMFIDALKDISKLDMLFYVPPGVETSSAAVSNYERSLSRHWNADLNLFLCPRATGGISDSSLDLYGRPAISLFKQPVYAATSGRQQVETFEDCLRRKPDAIFAHRLASMCPPLLTRASLPPVFFDLDDIEHVAFLRSIDGKWGWHSKLLYSIRFPALLWGERRAIQLAHRSFVCSESDRAYLAGRWRLLRVLTVPNAVVARQLLPVAPSPTLLFLGSYSYAPNVQAAEFLIQRIWPHIHQQMPEARLFIAGPQAESIRGYATGVPGVEFMGFVDDLVDLYQRSRVVCCPVLAGGGTRVKVIEAAAYGKPVVATRLGVEGLGFRDGTELYLRDDPKAFADACLLLLQNVALCERLGLAARAQAIELYDKARIVRSIQRSFQTVDSSAQEEPEPSECRAK